MAAKRSPRKATKKAAKKTTKKRQKKRSSKAKAPTAQDYLGHLRKLNKKDDQDFAMMAEDLILLPVKEWIPTGNLAIDKLTGGGWPQGRITEVASWEGVGKSTLLDQSIAQIQRMGGIAGLIDTEKARDRPYSEKLGVNTKDLIVHGAETVEEVFAGFEKFLAIQEMFAKKATPPPLLIIWDSLGGTPTNDELKGSADDVQVASAAKAIKRNLRRLVQRIANMRTTVVIANHFYKKIGFGGGGNEAYGGKGVAYFSSLRLWLARTSQLKLTNGTLVGHEVEAKLKKTRVGMPKAPVKTAVLYGAGFDNSYALFDWGKSHGVSETHRWIVQSGAHCWLYPPGHEPIHFQRTWFGLGALLTEHPDLYQQMASQYLASED